MFVRGSDTNSCCLLPTPLPSTYLVLFVTRVCQDIIKDSKELLFWNVNKEWFNVIILIIVIYVLYYIN